MTPELRDQIAAYTSERRYRPASVERWLSLADADAHALFDLASELRLGDNQLRDLWDCADEIAMRDGIGLAAVLQMPALLALRRRDVGRQDRLKLIKTELRRLRLPQLSALEDHLRQVVRQLQLPPAVRLQLPELLEGDGIQVEIRANSAQALRQAAAALLAAADSPTCAELFHLLDEAP